MTKSKGKGWIKGAIKHPGAERKAAKAAGMSTKAYMQAHAGSPGTAGKRARLGLRLEGMAVKGKPKPKPRPKGKPKAKAKKRT